MGKTASGMGGLSPRDGRRTGETLHVFLDVFRHTVFFPPFHSAAQCSSNVEKQRVFFNPVQLFCYFRMVMSSMKVHVLFQWE